MRIDLLRRFRGPTASIFIPVGGETVIEQRNVGVRVDRWTAPLFRRVMQSRSRSRQRTITRFYATVPCRVAIYRLLIAANRAVENRGRNRSKRNEIGTTFRASIPTKNRARNWSASYNTDRSPVAVGRGRELESPFTIIF